ncbi:MAG: ATP-grasp domain-containing protein [Planctomycetota bacterium]|nr:ATP-grasp domain-containing protein [Planctomycetota bacterium]
MKPAVYIPAVYIIGGGPLATSIPRWAREVGLVPVVTDKDPHAPGLLLAEETLVADGAAVEAHVDFARGLADRYRVVGVYCGGEFGLETARRVAEELALDAIPAAALRASLDKAATKRIWQEAGIPTPEGSVVASPGELRAVVDRGGAHIVKPTDGSGSRGVRVVDAESDLEAAFRACREAVGGTSDVLVEPFVEGRSIDANGAFLGGRYVPCGILEKFQTPPPARLPIGGCDTVELPNGESEAVHDLVERGARALGINTGPVKADLLRTREGYVLLEVAPRFHGDVTTVNTLPYGAGINPVRLLFRWFAERAVDESELLRGGEGYATWRVICLPPGEVEHMPDPPPPGEHPRIAKVWHNRKVKGSIPRYEDTVQVPGYVAAWGSDRDEAEEALVAWFSSAGYRVRPDPEHADWYRELGDRIERVGFTRTGSGWMEGNASAC